MRLPCDVARESRGTRPLVATTPLGELIPSTAAWDDGRGGDDRAGRRRPLISLPAAGRLITTDLAPRPNCARRVRDEAQIGHAVADFAPRLLELVERERWQHDATGALVPRRPEAVAYRLASWYRVRVSVAEVAELLQHHRTPVRPTAAVAPG